MPNPTDYMSDADKKAAYVAAVQAYYTAHAAYMVQWQKYSDALSKITTGNKFRKNNMFLSPNGRYLATARSTTVFTRRAISTSRRRTPNS